MKKAVRWMSLMCVLSAAPRIGPGGHWFQPGKAPRDNHGASATPCVIFIYTPQGFDFIPAKEHA